MSELDHRSAVQRLLVVLAVVAVVVHLFGLYRSTGPPSPSWFPHADKAEHVFGFAAPVCLILLARLWSAPVGWPAAHRFTLVVVVIFGLHAVVSELIQHFFYVHRTGDPFDTLADWWGVALGWGLARLVASRRGEGRRDDGPTDQNTVQVPR